MPDQEQSVDIPRGTGGEVIRVALQDYGGTQHLNIRLWIKGAGGQLLPTKKGICLPPSLLPDLIGALQRIDGTGQDAGEEAA